MGGRGKIRCKQEGGYVKTVSVPTRNEKHSNEILVDPSTTRLSCIATHVIIMLSYTCVFVSPRCARCLNYVRL